MPEDQNHTRFLHISPVLASSDVLRDIGWYEKKLGFKNVYDSTAYQEGSVDYAVLGRENQILHLQFQFPDDMTSTDVRFQVVNILPLLDEYIAAGVVKREKYAEKTGWNTSEFSLFDLSGNRLTFFEDLPE